MLSELNNICGVGRWRGLTEATGESQLRLRILDRLEWLAWLSGVGFLDVRFRAGPPLALTVGILDLLDWAG